MSAKLCSLDAANHSALEPTFGTALIQTKLSSFLLFIGVDQR